MKTYIGIKMIQAEPAEREGTPGYNVKYSDDHVSWCPKDVFEAAYLPLTVPYTIAQQDIDQLVSSATSQTIDPKTTLLRMELVTGFVLYDSASCVCAENYDEQKGGMIAAQKINEKVWFALGFVLQWAKFGLKHLPKLVPPGQEGNGNGDIK